MHMVLLVRPILPVIGGIGGLGCAQGKEVRDKGLLKDNPA